MEKIKNFFRKFTKKRENRNKVLFRPKKTLFKKRNYFYIKFDFNKYKKIFKKNYIPYYLIFGLFCLIITFFIILGPIFRVEKINIIKTDGNTDINIAYKSIDSLRGSSIFDVEKNEVFKMLTNYQENIKNISLKVNYPKTIDIQVESFKEKFNVNINGKNYILLENGSLIPTINPNKELKNLEIIKNIEKTKILDYKIIFDINYIKKIEEIEKKVLENIAYVEITNLKYYEREREFHIILNNFTRLIFSIDNDISVEEQIKILSVFNKDNSPIANNDKVYIDLRIRGKVFFCPVVNEKNQNIERQCKKNLEEIYGKL